MEVLTEGLEIFEKKISLPPAVAPQSLGRPVVSTALLHLLILRTVLVSFIPSLSDNRFDRSNSVTRIVQIIKFIMHLPRTSRLSLLPFGGTIPVFCYPYI
jgi:hypothetical protein